MPPIIQDTILSSNTPEFNFCSELFDAEKALKCENVVLPYPKSKTYNNLSEYYFHTFSKKKSDIDLNQPSLKSLKNYHFILKRNYEWYYATLGLNVPYNLDVTRPYKKVFRKKLSDGSYKFNKNIVLKEMPPEMLQPLQSEKIIVKRSNGSLKHYILCNGKRRYVLGNSMKKDEDTNVFCIKSLSPALKLPNKSLKYSRSESNKNSNITKIYYVKCKRGKVYTLYSFRHKIKLLHNQHARKHIPESEPKDALNIMKNHLEPISNSSLENENVCNNFNKVISLSENATSKGDEISDANFENITCSSNIKHKILAKRKLAVSNSLHYSNDTTNENYEITGTSKIEKENILMLETDVNLPIGNILPEERDATNNPGLKVTSSVITLNNDIAHEIQDKVSNLSRKECNNSYKCTQPQDLHQDSLVSHNKNAPSVTTAVNGTEKNENCTYSKERALLELAREARNKIRSNMVKKIAKMPACNKHSTGNITECVKNNINEQNAVLSMNTPDSSGNSDLIHPIVDQTVSSENFKTTQETIKNNSFNISKKYLNGSDSCNVKQYDSNLSFANKNGNFENFSISSNEALSILNYNEIHNNDHVFYSIKNKQPLRFALDISSNISKNIIQCENVINPDNVEKRSLKSLTFKSASSKVINADVPPFIVNSNPNLINKQKQTKSVTSVLKEHNSFEYCSKAPVNVPSVTKLKGYKIPKKRRLAFDDIENKM